VCVLAEFKDDRHVFSESTREYYHSLFIDTQHEDSLLLGAASVAGY